MPANGMHSIYIYNATNYSYYYLVSHCLLSPVSCCFSSALKTGKSHVLHRVNHKFSHHVTHVFIRDEPTFFDRCFLLFVNTMLILIMFEIQM